MFCQENKRPNVEIKNVRIKRMASRRKPEKKTTGFKAEEVNFIFAE